MADLESSKAEIVAWWKAIELEVNPNRPKAQLRLQVDRIATVEAECIASDNGLSAADAEALTVFALATADLSHPRFEMFKPGQRLRKT